eukprot:m.116687 g.116687  ORF g.116687 m.116687 type:complete len:978 (+) comp14240_c0_seq3:252-3185(+)
MSDAVSQLEAVLAERYRIAPTQAPSKTGKSSILLSSSEKEDSWIRCKASQFEGHNAEIVGVCLAGDDQLVSACSEGAVKVWNISSGTLIKVVTGLHQMDVRCLCVSRDAKYGFTGSLDKTIVKFSLALDENDKIQEYLGHTSEVRDLCISNDNFHLFSASTDRTIKMFNVISGSCIRTFTGHGFQVNSIRLNKNSTKLFSGSSDYMIKMWDVHTADCLATFEGHEYWVNSIELSQDERTLFSASGSTLAMWDIETQKMVRTTTMEDTVFDLSIHTSGNKLVLGMRDGCARIVDVATGNILRTLKKHNGEVRKVTVSKYGLVVYTATHHGEIRMWNIESPWNEKRQFKGHTDLVRGMCVSRDGKHLYTASRDRTVSMWDECGNRKRVFTGHKETPWTVCVSSDGKTLYSAGSDKKIKVWNVEDETMKPRDLLPHSKTVWALCLTKDDKYLFSASADYSIRMIDIQTGKTLKKFLGHEHEVRCLYLSHDDSLLISGSQDRTVKVWSVSKEAAISTCIGHGALIRAVHTSNKAHCFSASFDKLLKMWEIRTGKCVRTFEGHEGIVHSVYVTSDEKHLFSASIDKTIRIWNTTTAEPVIELKLQEMCYDVYFHEASDTLYYTHGDNAYSLPDVHTLLQGEFIPPAYLMLVAEVDMHNDKPNLQFSKVSCLMAEKPETVHTSAAFFIKLASMGSIQGLKKCLFDSKVTPSMILPYSHLLLPALNSSSQECIQFLLNEAARSILNSNSVLNKEAEPCFQHSQYEHDTYFVPILLRIGTLYPTILLEFLQHAPMLTALKVVAEGAPALRPDQSTELETIVTTCPANSSFDTQLWSKTGDSNNKAGGEVKHHIITESVVTPYQGFAAPGHDSLLVRALSVAHMHSVELFGTIIVAAVTRHKWTYFARAMFIREAVLFVIGLVCTVVASLLHHETNESRGFNHTHSGVLTVVLVLCCVIAVRDLWTDTLVLLRGPPGGYVHFLLTS